MTMPDYLWAAARDLRTIVLPTIDDATARETLSNGLRIISWVANALEADAPDGTSAPGGSGLIADTDRLPGPAENAAAWRGSAAAIAEAARTIDAGGEQRDAVAWEKAALDQAIARVDAIEYGASGSQAQSEAGHAIGREPLQDYLRRRYDAPDLLITTFKPIHGGRSRQTALFAITGCDALPAEMVVQRGLPGGGGQGFIDEALQFDLANDLLRAGLTVPTPVLHEVDDPALGAPFMITQRAPGSCVEPDFWLAPKERALVLELAREMALLHRHDPGPLADRLPHARDSYDEAGWLAELDALADTWRKACHWPSVTMSAAIAWMRANAGCIEDRRGLVHNDMLFHNIMAEDGRITGVLDWEMTAIGHPGEDLGYVYAQVSAGGHWRAFLDAYRAHGGTAISQREIDFFALRAGLRLINMVMAGGRDVFEQGIATGVLPASAGAHFSQRLLHRIAGVLDRVLAREAAQDPA